VNYRDLPALSKTERAKAKPPEKVSQTLLAKIDTCHRSAFLHLKHGGEDRDEHGERTLGTWQSSALIRGALFHECVRRAKRTLIDSQEESMPGELCKELMTGVIAEHPELVLPEFEQDACRIMAYNWGEATIVDPAGIIGVEEEFVWELANGTVTGKPDFAEITPFNTIKFRDYKTSLAMPSQDELQNGRRSFQGKLYACLLLFGKPAGEDFTLGEGIEQVEARQEYPRYTNDETGELLGRSVTYERTYLNTDFKATVEGHLKKLAHAFKTGKWQAVQGSHCGECPARTECPLPAHLRDLPEIESYEDAQDAGAAVLALEPEIKRLRKGMRAFADEDGRPIFVGTDYVWDFNEQTNSEGVTSTVFRKRKIRPEERVA
jgi:PD-(D/E)XK nuclease superfamily